MELTQKQRNQRVDAWNAFVREGKDFGLYDSITEKAFYEAWEQALAIGEATGEAKKEKWAKFVQEGNNVTIYEDAELYEKIQELEAKLSALEAQEPQAEAYKVGALAMAHYYHGEHATDEFKKDHGERAMRPEHLEWAKAALKCKPSASAGD